MRQTDAHRRRREQFMSDVLLLALDDATPRSVTPAGTPHGADLVTAVVDGVEVDGRTVGLAFSLLFADRRENGKETQLERVSTKWRDNMQHARSVNDATLLSGDDARRLLRMGMAQQKEASR